jgi:SAM-dependent methyltransferase
MTQHDDLHGTGHGETSSPTFSSAIADATSYTRWISETFAPYAKGRILEVGIGHGGYFVFLSKLGRYTGIDIDPQNVASARRRFPQADFRVSDICAKQFQSEFPQGSVDTIVCCNVIEHIENDRLAVANLANVLSTGGHLLLLVPALRQLYGDMDRLAGHHRRYDQSMMRRTLDGLPLEIRELRFFNPVGGVAWWINTFFRHKSLDSHAINAQIRIFDRLVVPVSRGLDFLTRGFFGQSLICIARKT